MSRYHFVTAYSYTVKRRKTGRVMTIGTYYHTKSLTPMHAHIRSKYPDAVTYAYPNRVWTHLTPFMNLGHRPIVSGGWVIGGNELTAVKVA